ncbi:PQQ-dependent sugar dehydrogenase [Rheinheimera sp. MMS21-TC3]|uniref:PQQ-dependent sugar dehydrogenase n=1 Tax=Rheinheimera sp. MMS21-TC3 TaxID=3072790 RepID=UPI0028C3833F|nr:PQQ-dependent sugar dehydrogenase [Rheinheimera sp. MMS21-TC3]WNO60209.1 PQQ-dependent sugar dehydrogenase [Rheinheimera sp. MMS21-TC3]
MKPLTMTFLLLSLGLISLTSHADSDILKTRWADVKVDTVTSGLNHPWGLAFLGDGRMLVTERAGNLRIVAADGTIGEPISGLPEIKVRGQGGLFDLRLSPNFSQDNIIYFSYSEPETAGSEITSTAVARARLENNKLHDLKVIFSQQPKVMGGRHYGGRLAFSADGEFLFIGLGDHGHRQEDVQNLSNHTGKLVRIHPDGSVPKTNPFVHQADAKPEIWSYGHRNIQGMDIQPTTGKLWTVEHGPQGGDEVNMPQPGLNYGWPVITHGEQYGGGEVGIGFKKDGMEQPIWHWTPSIAVSGVAFYQGDQFPQWQGNLLATGLKGQQVARLEVNGDHVIHQETLNLERRIREVKIASDGSIYLLTDEPKGAILRLLAAK